MKTGDFVVAFDETKQDTVISRVTNVVQKTWYELRRIIAGQDTILATENHPFFLPCLNRYLPADSLRQGMQLLSLVGTLLTVQQVTAIDTTVQVYNFEVEEHHNYFVGEAGILVHNENEDCFLAKAGLESAPGASYTFDIIEEAFGAEALTLRPILSLELQQANDPDLYAFFRADDILEGNPDIALAELNVIRENRVKAWEVLYTLGDARKSDPVELQKVLTYFEETNISRADFDALYHAESNKARFFRRCKVVDNIDFLQPFALHDAFRVEKPRVLSLGEGNFSFSASISDDISEVNQANFLATEYRTYEQLATAENIDQAHLDDALAFLSSNGVEFRFGIDGTNLPTDIGNFDVVVFNFPFVHNPPTSIASTESMLRGVITHMETRLNPGGKLFITQKANWANALNLSSIADESSIISLVGDKKWSVQDFPGYNHVITNPDNTSTANVNTGITFVFSKE